MSQSLEALKGRIESARTLRSIVKTMKILAAVGLRQDELAREALAEYAGTIELGLQVALRSLREGAAQTDRGKGDPRVLAILIGSDMGMCGQFNERLADHAARELSPYKPARLCLIAVGERLALRLEDLGLPPATSLPCPANPSAGTAGTIRRVLRGIDEWRAAEPSREGRVIAFHNRHAGRGTEIECRSRILLPLDRVYLGELRRRAWNSRSLPIVRMEGPKFIHACLRGTLYVFLYRAFLDSLESENAARLEAMESAERHIDEHLGELRAWYNEARQEAITSELLDIIAGVEAARGATEAAPPS